jgi:hypothetical protein
MTPEEVESWFWSAREKLKSAQKLEPAWWPNTTDKGNAGVTPLGYLFFLGAAASRCSGRQLTVAAEAPDGSVQKAVIDKEWLSPGTRDHSPSEVLVDFSVHNWAASSPIQLTGESEGGPYHGTGDSLESRTDDYSWDFYKLLVMPSTTRLFFARVGRTKGSAIPDRIQALVTTLQGLVDWYAPALLRPHDELGVVLLPSRRSFASETRILWLDRGRLKVRNATVPADVNPLLEDEDAADA